MNNLLGKRIKQLRESNGMNLEELASKTNYSLQKLNRIEKGMIDISYNNIIVIAKALNISHYEIINIIDNNTEKSYPEDLDFNFIKEMIDFFYANKKLYENTKQMQDK